MWEMKHSVMHCCGQKNFLIHQEQGDSYIREGTLAEAFLHEGGHTSLDDRTKNDPAWIAAQEKDPGFISTYARDNPQREDIAESFPMWFAARYRKERISTVDYENIVQIMPNRLAYFDAKKYDLGPQVDQNSGGGGSNGGGGGSNDGGGRICSLPAVGLAFQIMAMWYCC